MTKRYKQHDSNNPRKRPTDYTNPHQLKIWLRPRVLIIAIILLVGGLLYFGYAQQSTDKIGQATYDVCKDYSKRFGDKPWFADWYNKECKKYTTLSARCGDGNVNPEIGEECEGNSEISCSSLNMGYDYGTAYCVQCSYDKSACSTQRNCQDIKDKIDSYTKELSILQKEYNSCTASLSTGYKNSYIICNDGWELYEGSEADCKSENEWQSYAVNFCKTHCNAKTGKCGLQKVDMWNDCSIGTSKKVSTTSSQSSSTITRTSSSSGSGTGQGQDSGNLLSNEGVCATLKSGDECATPVITERCEGNQVVKITTTSTCNSELKCIESTNREIVYVCTRCDMDGDRPMCMVSDPGMGDGLSNYITTDFPLYH